jgi:hypothetical protein
MPNQSNFHPVKPDVVKTGNYPSKRGPLHQILSIYTCDVFVVLKLLTTPNRSLFSSRKPARRVTLEAAKLLADIDFL